jgi:signal transduction histidine kinase
MLNMEKSITLNLQKDINTIANIPAVSKMLEVICQTTGMGFAVVARVTTERWIACAVNDKINFGLGIGGELKVETTLCHEVREFNKTIAIDKVASDPVYSSHHTPAMYGLQSYISLPITLKNGEFFGTLCAIDPKPALVNNDRIINMFKLFAELISFHIDAVQSLSDNQVKISEMGENAELREQFVAMLGHDLRNPISAISSAVQLQLRSNLDERNSKLAKIIQNATIRTRGLIDNILDFASGRLGGGITLNFENSNSLEEALRQVITEILIAYPERKIEVKFDMASFVKSDTKRIAQLFSNILGNAISHGDKNTPIFVDATTNKGAFDLSVTNMGTKISEEALNQLFKPFSRGKVRIGQEGLGLGLFICQQIANAHNGEIKVESTDEKTCFTFRIPSSATPG